MIRSHRLYVADSPVQVESPDSTVLAAIHPAKILNDLEKCGLLKFSQI